MQTKTNEGLILLLPQLKGGSEKRNEKTKIRKFCLYEDLPTPELKAAIHLVIDWDDETTSTRIDCYDLEGDFLFAKVEQQHVAEYLSNFENEEERQLLDFMTKNEIDFIQY